MTATTQGALAERVIGDLETLRAAYAALGRATPDATLHRMPPGGGWSAAMVFRHLVLMHDDYLRAIRERLAEGGEPGDASTPWKASMAGTLLRLSMESARPVKAPPRWRVTEPPPPTAGDLRQALDASFAGLVALARESAGIDWRRTRLASPASSLIRLNLGDALLVLAVHARRHLAQVERVLGPT